MARISALTAAFFLMLTCSVFLPVAHAGQWDQMTKIKFDRAVRVPGSTLPPGSYYFVLANDSSDRNIVRIYSEDWKRSYATIATEPVIRKQVTNRTELVLAERHNNKPNALMDWYFSDNKTGHEFIYPRHEEQRLDRDAKLTLVPPGIPGM